MTIKTLLPSKALPGSGPLFTMTIVICQYQVLGTIFDNISGCSDDAVNVIVYHPEVFSLSRCARSREVRA